MLRENVRWVEKRIILLQFLSSSLSLSLRRMVITIYNSDRTTKWSVKRKNNSLKHGVILKGTHIHLLYSCAASVQISISKLNSKVEATEIS